MKDKKISVKAIQRPEIPLSKMLDKERKKQKISQVEIAAAMGMSNHAYRYRLKNGGFAEEELQPGLKRIGYELLMIKKLD